MPDENVVAEIPDENVVVEIPDANFKAYLLEYFDTNKDGEISLSEAKVVEEIDCSNRSIKDLTGIEKFENLKRLNCSNNQLDELEVRYNKKLEWIDIRNNVDDIFTVYFAASGPLRNRNFETPKENEDPDVTKMINPIDVSKCLYNGQTYFVVIFEE